MLDISATFTTFIANNTWIFAKTYAATAPHEYLVKEKLSAENQEILKDFVTFIKENGYVKMFFGHPFTYFDIGAYAYRTDQGDAEDISILNRALIENMDNYK